MPARLVLRVIAVLLLATLSFAAADTPPAAQKTSSVAELLQARVDAAADGMRLATERYKAGMGTPIDLTLWTQRWTDAKLETAQTKDQRLDVMRQGLTAMREREILVQKMFEAGMGATQVDVTFAKYERLGAEIRLARALAE